MLNTTKQSKKYLASCLCVSVIISLLDNVVITSFPLLRLPTLMIAFILFIAFSTRTHPSLLFNTTIISFSISYVFLIISGFFSSLLIISVTPYKESFPFLFFILNGILQYALVHIPFQLRRLKKGMPFLASNNTNYIGPVLCIPIFISIIIFQTLTFQDHYIYNIIFISLYLSIFFAGLLLLLWWRSRLTRSYLDRLQQSELESLRNQLAEYELENNKLMENNNSLARIIHKDNKLIPAMELAVEEFLSGYKTLDSTALENQGQTLLATLSEISKDRIGIIHDYQAADARNTSTGCCSVDAIISLMKKRAAENHIDFDISIHADLSTPDSLGISEADLTHLLADLLENALIAMREQSSGHLLVYFGYMKDALVLEVSDSGAAFAPEVFQDFGMEPHTTHSDTGGSGIGLMDIWAIKKKCRASLHVIEYSATQNPTQTTYTKKLSFLFDNKNRYAIRTYRRKDLQRILMRNDLIVLSDS